MQFIKLNQTKSFRVLANTPRSQVAEMVIRPGDKEGGPNNKHGADQWMYVVEGAGFAIVNGKKLSLRKGNLLLIEKGDKHEIRAVGRGKFRTLNFYSPKVY